MTHARFLSLLLLGAAIALPAAAEGIRTAKTVPYAEPDKVREAIRKECDLERKLAAFLKAHGFTPSDDLTSGKVLDAKIADAVTGGGPWGAGVVTVSAELRDGGTVVGTATAQRNTTRGAGACGRLQVAAEAVAEDLAGWAKAPSMDAKLGNAK